MVVRVEGVRPQPGRKHRLCCALLCSAVLRCALLARPGHGWGGRGLQQCLGRAKRLSRGSAVEIFVGERLLPSESEL